MPIKELRVGDVGVGLAWKHLLVRLLPKIDPLTVAVEEALVDGFDFALGRAGVRHDRAQRHVHGRNLHCLSLRPDEVTFVWGSPLLDLNEPHTHGDFRAIADQGAIVGKGNPRILPKKIYESESSL